MSKVRVDHAGFGVVLGENKKVYMRVCVYMCVDGYIHMCFYMCVDGYMHVCAKCRCTCVFMYSSALCRYTALPVPCVCACAYLLEAAQDPLW